LRALAGGHGSTMIIILKHTPASPRAKVLIALGFHLSRDFAPFCSAELLVLNDREEEVTIRFGAPARHFDELVGGMAKLKSGDG
jgi:hypothetical protein